MSKSTPMKVADNTGVQIATPMDILNNAVMGGADVETLERLLAMQERWEANQARKAFDAAMADLRADLPEIIKSREVDFTSNKGRTRYKYEDLSIVTDALGPAMADHGLSFRWRTGTENNAVRVTCIIAHRDGHSEETTLSAAPDTTGNKNDIQSIGSSLAYLQRYTLKAAVGVAAAPDIDGGGVVDDTAASDTQIATIQKLIDEFEVDIPRFCKFMGVEAVKDIPARDFTKAVNNLERKRVRK